MGPQWWWSTSRFMFCPLEAYYVRRPILMQYVPPHGFSMGLWSPGHLQCLSSRCGSVCCCKCHCSPFFAAVVPLCVLLELTQHFGWREVECVGMSVCGCTYASKCVMHNVTPCSCGCCVMSPHAHVDAM